MLTITLLGTGSPLPDPHRAGPATLVQGGGEHVLVDAGRGVLMRLAAAGVPVSQLTAVLITHLHSDHITDLNDVITSQWISTFQPTPLRIVGPVGTRAVVGHIVDSLGPDIGYRLAHHDDLDQPPLLEITEIDPSGPEPIDGLGRELRISAAPTDHRPVEPSVAFRFDLGSGEGGVAAVVAGDTVPCAGLDALCAGAQALVHTVIRKDVIATIPLQRLQDTLDYHSSPEEAAQTAERAGMDILVLTHYVPAFPPGGGAEWRDLAAAHFSGRVEVGDDLHRVDVAPAHDPGHPTTTTEST
jgi:ribonuclease Z